MILATSGQTVSGVGVLGPGIGFECASILEDVTLDGVRTNGCSIGLSLAGPYQRRNIAVRHSRFMDSAAPYSDPTHGHGIYAAQTDGLTLEDVVVSGNVPAPMHHGVYLTWNTRNVLARRLAVIRCGDSGVECRPSAVFEDLVVAECKIGLSAGAGNAGEFVAGGVDVVLVGCVIVGGAWALQLNNARVKAIGCVLIGTQFLAAQPNQGAQVAGWVPSTLELVDCVVGGAIQLDPAAVTLTRTRPSKVPTMRLTPRERAAEPRDLLASLRRRYGA